MHRRNRLAARPRIEFLEARTVLTASTPATLAAAYGLDAITLSAVGGPVRGDGTGQTIAIVDAYHDADLAAELATFNARYALPAAPLSVVNLAASATNASWASEEAMDVEWAHALAPGATIVVIEAASSSIPDLLAGVQVARQIPGVSVVSMSWGSPEFAGETADDALFTTPAGHTGITYLAATGDNGPGAQWPASSPNVVAVGGTSLTVATAGSRVESSWASSGGGVSTIEAEPGYQRSAQSTGRRTVPDVAFEADPATGVAVYSVAAGGWILTGGTSLGAPAWGAIVAIANQGRALAGLGTLDGATQTLPALYAALPAAFADVASGPGATVGFDTAAGLGTPNGPALLAALGAPTAGASAAPGLIAAKAIPGSPTMTALTTSTSTTSTSTSTVGGHARARKPHHARARHSGHPAVVELHQATHPRPASHHAVDAALAGWRRIHRG